MGCIKNTGSRVVVLYLEVPNDPTYCLVVEIDTIRNESFKLDILDKLQSPAGQSSNCFGELLGNFYQENKKSILQNLHELKLIRKIETNMILLNSDGTDEITVEKVNNQLRRSKNQSEVYNTPVDKVVDNKTIMTNSNKSDVVLTEDMLKNDPLFIQSELSLTQKHVNEIIRISKNLTENSSQELYNIVKPLETLINSIQKTESTTVLMEETKKTKGRPKTVV